MDSWKTGYSDTEFICCVCCYIDHQYGDRLHGSLCNRKTPLEAGKALYDLFPDRYDDTGTLRYDPVVYQICKNGVVKQSGWSDDSLYYFFTAGNDLYHDRLL